MPQPPLWGDAGEAEDETKKADHAYEVPLEGWAPLALNLPERWRPSDWDLRPIRFIDGKDVGETVTCLTSPEGYPVPVRLSEIGSVVMRVEGGTCRREDAFVQRVVAMVAGVFPWHEVEAFAAALQGAGMLLLVAQLPKDGSWYDFERMRKAAQNRSLDEMGVLEELAVQREPDVPSIVDGRLEPRVGGLDPERSPVFGVIKTHREIYLHPLGMQVLYRLGLGERTPVFSLPNEKLPVVSWYVRFAGGERTMPNWGYVRVEASKRWFEDRQGRDFGFVDQLSRTLFEYRSREHSYGRAPVSLDPIVRAERSLGALFAPPSALASRFYHLTGL